MRWHRRSSVRPSAFGVPDIVVNNAGITHRNRPILEVDEATFDRIFAVNVKSIFNMVRAVVPLMRDNGGGVMLNVGSTAGMRPRPGPDVVQRVEGRCESGVEVAGRGAGALADSRQRALPGDGRHRHAERLHGRRGHAGEPREVLATIPLGRLSQPEDIAAAALCSSRRTKPRSSPASSCRSTAGGRCSVSLVAQCFRAVTAWQA